MSNGKKHNQWIVTYDDNDAPCACVVRTRNESTARAWVKFWTPSADVISVECDNIGLHEYGYDVVTIPDNWTPLRIMDAHTMQHNDTARDYVKKKAAKKARTYYTNKESYNDYCAEKRADFDRRALASMDARAEMERAAAEMERAAAEMERAAKLAVVNSDVLATMERKRAAEMERAAKRAKERAIMERKNARVWEDTASDTTLNARYAMNASRVLALRACKTALQNVKDVATDGNGKAVVTDNSGINHLYEFYAGSWIHKRRMDAMTWLNDATIENDGTPVATMDYKRRKRKIKGVMQFTEKKELALTLKGKSISAVIADKKSPIYAQGTPFDDLANTALMMIYDNAANGIVKCDADIFSDASKKRIFSAVNSALYQMRKDRAQTAEKRQKAAEMRGDMPRVNSGEKKSGSNVRALSRDEIDSLYEYTPRGVWEACADITDHVIGTSVEDTKILYMIMCGYTRREIGAALNKSHVAITKRVTKIRQSLLRDFGGTHRAYAEVKHRLYNHKSH